MDATILVRLAVILALLGVLVLATFAATALAKRLTRGRNGGHQGIPLWLTPDGHYRGYWPPGNDGGGTGS